MKFRVDIYETVVQSSYAFIEAETEQEARDIVLDPDQDVELLRRPHKDEVTERDIFEVKEVK